MQKAQSFFIVSVLKVSANYDKVSEENKYDEVFV